MLLIFTEALSTPTCMVELLEDHGKQSLKDYILPVTVQVESHFFESSREMKNSLK